MGHFLIEKKLLRDKLKLQGQGLRETLKKGKQNQHSISLEIAAFIFNTSHVLK